MRIPTRFTRTPWQSSSALALVVTTVLLAFPALAVPVQGPNGDYYELVSTPMTWENARTAALGMSFQGQSGFLATSLSPETNLFLASLLNGSNAWLGGNDVLVADTWVWADGPNAGVAFWQGQQGGSPVGGAYNNWGSADPNNSGGNQYAQLMCAQNTSPCVNENLGEWIDRPGSDLHAFLVEYLPIPEPSTAPLLALGLVALASRRRRHRHFHRT